MRVQEIENMGKLPNVYVPQQPSTPPRYLRVFVNKKITESYGAGMIIVAAPTIWDAIELAKQIENPFADGSLYHIEGWRESEEIMAKVFEPKILFEQHYVDF